VSSINRTAQHDGHKLTRNVAALMVFEAATLAVASGLHPDLGPLAAAYTFSLALAGPVLGRLSEPLGRRLAARQAA